MVENPSSGILSISLKQFLGIAFLFGPGIGIVGRIYNEYHTYYPAALIGLFVAVPFLIATITLIRVGMSRGNRNLILWGVLCLLMPAMGGIAYWQFPWSTDGVSHLSNKKLAEKVTLDWKGRKASIELTKRAENGSLNKKYAQLAFDNLLATIQKRVPSNSFLETKSSMKFVKMAQDKGLLPEKVQTKLWDCFYGPMGELHQHQKIRRTDKKLQFIFTINQQHLFDYENCLFPIWSYKNVLIDGKPFDIEIQPSDRYSGNIPMTYDHTVYYTNEMINIPIKNLEAGDHLISIEVDFAYVRPESIEGLKVGYFEKEVWPETVKEWSKTFDLKFHIYLDDEPLIERVTDPKYDPLRNKVVTADKLMLQRGADGQSLLLLDCSFTNMEHVTYEMKVTAEVEGKQYKLGRFKSRRPQGRWWQYWDSPERVFQEKMEVFLPTPSEDVTKIDLLFEPDITEQCMRQGNVEAVWDKAVWLRDVPVERRDIDKHFIADTSISEESKVEAPNP